MIESSSIISEPQNGGCSRRDILAQSVIGGICLSANPSPSLALSASEASKAYDSYASNYDSLDGGSASTMLGIDQARADLFKQAKGKVLEIGAGTGLNLEKYDFSKIESLTLLDISQGMLTMAEQRWKNMTAITTSSDDRFIYFVQADATSGLVSKFGAQCFDTVVDSFSLCTMGNDGAEKCLSQLSQVVKSKEEGGMSNCIFYTMKHIWWQQVSYHRYLFPKSVLSHLSCKLMPSDTAFPLRPRLRLSKSIEFPWKNHTGQVLLLENSRSSNPFLAKYQDATSTAAAEMGGKGCVYNQDVESMIHESTKGKLKIESQEQYAAGLFRAFRCTVA